MLYSRKNKCNISIVKTKKRNRTICLHLINSWNWHKEGSVSCVALYSSSIFSCQSFVFRKGIYFFFPIRAHLVPLSGHVNYAAAQHVFYGTTSREGGVWDVLPGSCALPQLLLALSHRLLPLREGVSHLLQVSPHRHRSQLPSLQSSWLLLTKIMLKKITENWFHSIHHTSIDKWFQCYCNIAINVAFCFVNFVIICKGVPLFTCLYGSAYMLKCWT